MSKFLFNFLFLTTICNAQIQFSAKAIDLGSIKEAYEIKGDVILKNTSLKKVYLLRADADKGLKIFTSKKTLLPDDSCLLIISFIPESGGRFNKNIRLVASDQDIPHELSLSGNLSKLKTDDKTACYYFGNSKNNNVRAKEMPVVINEPNVKRDNTNRIPDTPPVAENVPPVASKTNTQVITETPVKEVRSDELPVEDYRPNNILFLVDVSGSMKDSLKLPLMKVALHTLIDAIRGVDRVTFVTYADSVKTIAEAVSGSQKSRLHEMVDELRAKGLTKGNKAILFSQVLAQKHYIAGGNNQIILATDGKFRFYVDDFNTWKQRQADKKIVMSTVAFGNDREAMKNLKEIAQKGEGSFIHIKKRNGSRNKLLDEIKDRSKIR